MVTAFFERLGNLGVLLIAVALLMGGLAGAAITHQYERTSFSSVASEHQRDKNAHDQKPPKNRGQGKQKHPSNQSRPGTPEPPDRPETD